MVKVVIFDLDDTLVSEQLYIESGYRYIAKFLSTRIRKNEQELYRELTELFTESSKDVFDRLLDKYEICYSIANVFELVEEYRNHFPNIKFYEDVLPTLGILQKKGIKTGIITDGYANAQRQKLKAVKAYDYFNNIIITDEMGREYWKPHPKSFEMMQEKFNVKFNEIVYVGDNPEKDFYISKIYPVKTVRIQREGVYKDRIYLDNIKESHLIYGLGELEAIVGE